MTTENLETIAAIATPPGRGGVGIIRISGPQAPAIAKALLGVVPAPRQAELHRFRDANQVVLDEGIALYFPEPHSFTGENIVELQGHGGPAVLDMILSEILTLGARMARPGEFSERAFLNNKLDLIQAEAVADLIDSHSHQAARAALRSLQGVFSNDIHQLVEQLTQLRMYVEAAIDFPDEEIDFLGNEIVSTYLQDIHCQYEVIVKAASQGRVLREGLTVVLAGPPNAGKSSLMNALARRDTAIVTEVPGTTRDVLRERILLDDLPVHLVDTAGLRDTDDPVERQGVQRAEDEIGRADLVLWIVDDSLNECVPEFECGAVPCLRVFNKIDVSKRPPGLTEFDDGDELALSATGGAGLETLTAYLKKVAGLEGNPEGVYCARRRHLDALNRTGNAITLAEQALGKGAGELVAEELRQAQNHLGEITGEVTADDLLGRIFSDFCIGK